MRSVTLGEYPCLSEPQFPFLYSSLLWALGKIKRDGVYEAPHRARFPGRVRRLRGQQQRGPSPGSLRVTLPGPAGVGVRVPAPLGLEEAAQCKQPRGRQRSGSGGRRGRQRPGGHKGRRGRRARGPRSRAGPSLSGDLRANSCRGALLSPARLPGR